MLSISLENHKFENICSPLPLKIIASGTYMFNPTVSGPRRTYVPNICLNYIDSTYARDGRGLSHLSNAFALSCTHAVLFASSRVHRAGYGFCDLFAVFGATRGGRTTDQSLPA